MMSGWNRGASVTDSEFVWVGEHAIVSAGLSGNSFDNTAPDAAYGEGPLVARNLAHELGIFVKQAGFYYQGMTANATVTSNVFFNGPRAGINFNDGFGGGHEVSKNVAFNFVRETSDHGPFNSWDRNTYMWGSGRLDPLPISLDHNLFVCNYYCVVPIDNDDGSNGYLVNNNVLLWGGTKSLMGYNKHFVNNTFVYVDYTPLLSTSDGFGFETKFGVCATEIASAPFASKGLQDQWYGNTCIANSSSRFFLWMSCNSTDLLDGTIPVPLSGNRYMSSDGGYEMVCSGKHMNFTEVQAMGADLESTVSTLPTIQELVDLAHEVLQF